MPFHELATTNLSIDLKCWLLKSFSLPKNCTQELDTKNLSIDLKFYLTVLKITKCTPKNSVHLPTQELDTKNLSIDLKFYLTVLKITKCTPKNSV